MTQIGAVFTVWKLARAPIGKLHVINPLRPDRTVCGHVIPSGALTEYMVMPLEVMQEHGCHACAWLFFSEMWILWYQQKRSVALAELGITPGDQK